MNENPCWANEWLAALLPALGGVAGEIDEVCLRFEFGHCGVAIIKPVGAAAITLPLPIFGTVPLSGPLNLPRGVQAITITIPRDGFATVNCRFAPIDMPLASLMAALKLQPA